MKKPAQAGFFFGNRVQQFKNFVFRPAKMERVKFFVHKVMISALAGNSHFRHKELENKGFIVLFAVNTNLARRVQHRKHLPFVCTEQTSASARRLFSFL